MTNIQESINELELSLTELWDDYDAHVAAGQDGAAGIVLALIKDYEGMLATARRQELASISDEELSEGLDILEEQAAEIINEQIQFGDSGPGTARTIRARNAWRAEYECRLQARIAALPQAPWVNEVEDDCPF